MVQCCLACTAWTAVCITYSLLKIIYILFLALLVINNSAGSPLVIEFDKNLHGRFLEILGSKTIYAFKFLIYQISNLVKKR